MIPQSWPHEGTTYSLAHLVPSRQNCAWTNKLGITNHFFGRIRYSNHCISVKAELPLNDQTPYLRDNHGSCRHFDLNRYHLSRSLPSMIESLFLKPTKSVNFTAHSNYFVLQSVNFGQLLNADKYYAFFNVKYNSRNSSDPLQHYIELYVESAYCRQERPQTPHHKERLMFGDLLTRLIKN